ncbi:MAG: type VI secretion system contractile sheath large subunit [Candidatus Eisenbacteria bacterium]|uniref:Type VI secretion system contractile sheath large subunit n=1 Tax=Eiseniibacteriota bacterium TaxID=2212470 RepID=A0A933SA34_UNCEI|nr:type VI secretion system contractile sheath large subunit [Candidatus Eisenbacteria bacterium]
MSSMPWRIVVITDVGVDSGNPAEITPGPKGADGWFASLGLTLPLPGAGTPDTVLHDPKTQRVEAAWRGLNLLASHAAEPLLLEALSVPRAQLVARFREEVYEPALESGAPPLTMVVLDFDFTHKASDVADLAALGAMAADLQACIVAHAHAGILDLRFLVQAAAMQEVASKLNSPAHAGFAALQKSDDARWLSLTLNRFLLREPFDGEKCTESNPDSYLWGRGGWLVGAALARSLAAHGHALDLSGAGGRFENMATRGYPVKTNESQALATEIPFGEMQMLLLAHGAFAPLVGALNASTVNLPLVTTIHRLAPGKLTLEGTLSYQLTAGRFAQVCGAMLSEAPTGASDEDASAWLVSRLRADLGGLLKDAAEDALTVVMEKDEEGARTAVVTLKPALTLEGKNPEFVLGLPIA